MKNLMKARNSCSKKARLNLIMKEPFNYSQKLLLCFKILPIPKKMFILDIMQLEEMLLCKLVSIKELYMIFQLLLDLMRVMLPTMEVEEIVYYSLVRLMKHSMNFKKQFNFKQTMEFSILTELLSMQD